MERKIFNLLNIKTDEDGQQPGSFSALASVFGNVDHVGDRVERGAFRKTLKKWRESGRPLPVILSHQWENPFATVGKADPRAVIETEDGLLVQGTLDIEGNDTAKQVHKLMKEGLMTGWSFGYTVPDGGEKMKDGVNEITEIDLVEVGPTLKGANSEAQLQAVKSALDVEAPPAPLTEKARKAIYLQPGEPNPSASRQIPTTSNPVGEVDIHWGNAITTDATAFVPPAAKGYFEALTEEDRELLQEIYDACEGDLKALLKMWHAVKPDPLSSDEELKKAVEADEEIEAAVAERLEERLKTEPDPEVPKPQEPPEPVKDLLEQEVKSAGEKPDSPPVKAAANDPLKDEIARLRLEIAADL